MTNYWIGVASKKHVEIGVKGGFCQLNHGKKAPLQRMKAGDWLLYYSPKLTLDGGEPYQQFTAIGQIRQGEAFQVEMTTGFSPFRKGVDYYQFEREFPLQGLRDLPEWQVKRPQLRFGHFPISEDLFRVITSSMGKAEMIGGQGIIEKLS